MSAPTAGVVQPRELRSYQTAAVAAVERAWSDGPKSHRVGVVLPTGAGKSTVIGKLAANAYRAGQRVLMIAHRGELVNQMRRDLMAVDPMIPPGDIGIVRAEQNAWHAPIVVATLQTLASKKRRDAVGKRHVVLWDEVHHAGAEGFNTTFEELGGYDASTRMCGFTATMYRNETGTIGLGDVIQKVVYEKDLRWAIKHGFLVQPRGLTVHIEGLDKLNDVRNVAGDFKNDDMAEIMEAAVDYVVDAVDKHARERTSIVFAPSVDGAHMLAESLSARGMSAEAVTGAMPLASREPIYERFRTGATKNLVTVMVLTEGADFPMCDAVVMARPTRSKNLYAQMVGRALRLYTDPWTGEVKSDALVLDLSGTTRQMRLINLTDLAPGAEVREVDTDGEEFAICAVCDLYMHECICGVEDEGGGGEAPEKLVRMGPVQLVDIDLLANSDSLWLETAGGIPFVSGSGNLAVFLWPEGARRDAQRWCVGVVNTRTKAADMVTEYVDVVDAADAAEAWIYDNPDVFTFASKSASWRRNQPPSDKQLKLAKSMGIPSYEDMTKARLSDEISCKFVGRALDKHLETTSATA